MNDNELQRNFARLTAEIDFLRARSDALSIALKYAIINAPNAPELLAFISEKLDATSDLAIFSSQPSDAYLEAFRIAKDRIAGWQDALNDAG